MSKMILDALGFKPANSNSFGTPVQTIAALAQVALTELTDKQVRLVEDSGAMFRFDAESTATADNAATIKPNAIANGNAGRWLLMTSPAAPVDTTNLVTKSLIGVDGGVQPYQKALTGFGRVGSVTASRELVEADIGMVRVDASAGDLSITLPDANTVLGCQFWFKRVDSTTNKVTILPKAGSNDLVNSAASYTLLARLSDFAIFVAGAPDRWTLFAKSDTPLLDQVGHITTPDGTQARSTAGYQLTLADAGFVRCNASTGPMKLILPAEKISAGYKFFFKKTDLSTNKVTLTTVAGDTIEGWPEYELTVPRDYVVLESCGLTNTWRIFASTPPGDKFYNWASAAGGGAFEIGRSMTGSHYVDASKGLAHMHLPRADETSAQSYFIKKTDASTNIVEVHVADNSPDTFDIGGNTLFELNTKGDFVRIASDGTTWRVMQQELHLNYGPPAYIDAGGSLISIARFHLPFFNSGNNLTSGLLLAYGANSQPQYMSRNYKVKSIRVSLGVAVAYPTTFSIRLNGSTQNFYTVTLPAGQIGFTISSLELLMSGDDTIQIYANSVARMNNPTCILEYCWRN